MCQRKYIYVARQFYVLDIRKITNQRVARPEITYTLKIPSGTPTRRIPDPQWDANKAYSILNHALIQRLQIQCAR